MKKVVLKINNSYLHNEKEIAECFAKHFSRFNRNVQLYVEVTNMGVSSDLHYSQVEVYNRNFTLEELKQALSHTNSSAPGPDFIPADFIKEMSEGQLYFMLIFYNHVWNWGLPDQWKECTTIPLLRYGKVSSDIESYRPISLKNNMCKIMERMVTKRLANVLESNNSINDCQSGYRKQHASIDAICRIENSIRYSFMRGEHCLTVFLDISSAFDCVNHKLLMDKILQLGIKGNMGMFIRDFLRVDH